MTMVDVDQGIDQGIAWHYGDPLREQRWLADGTGVVALGNREVVRIGGADRATLLNLLGTQKLDALAPGESSSTYLLDPQGHIAYFLALVNAPDAIWGWTEPGCGAPLASHLTRMRFRLDVNIDLRPDLGVVWAGKPQSEPGTNSGPVRSGTPNCLGGWECFLPQETIASGQCVDRLGGHPAGLWAYTARRIEAGVVRVGVDTDHRTLPNEVGVPSENLALNKGCYPGQETVARVHNVGAPPRRLVRLHLDGSQDRLLESGTELRLAGDPSHVVGWIGSMAYHHELGPIALGLIKRETDDSATFLADGIAASAEALVTRDAGLHVRFTPGAKRLK